MNKPIHRNKKFFVVMGLALMMLVASATWVLAQTDGVIYACVLKDGTLRIVTDDSQCKKGETLLSWNIMGPKGDPGLACWDLNGNGIGDAEEDVNGDAVVDVGDCKGAQGLQGETGSEGPQGPEGPIGPEGPQGPQGEPGDAAKADPPCFDNTNRYADCGNGTVTDAVTGLIWLRDANCFGGRLAWAEANAAAAGLADGVCDLTDGSSPGDWRLPTRAEWEATVARAYALGCYNDNRPVLTNTTGTGCYRDGPQPFINVIPMSYWSSTGYDLYPNLAWAQHLGMDEVPWTPLKINPLSVWPVRRDHNETLLEWNSVGPQGKPGLACWDLNGDGIGNLPDEDVNGDTAVDVGDCKGAQGLQGEMGSVANRQLIPAANSLTILDSEGSGGETSITIGADGLPVISYCDATNMDLKVAHCNDTACTSATTTTLDSDGYVGSSLAITIGADGLPVISYTAFPNLKVAHCNNTACTSATTTTVDSEYSVGNQGDSNSITIGADGLPVISYWGVDDNWRQHLKVAHCNDTVCTSATTTTLSSASSGETSIMIGADGLPVISYEGLEGDLKVAHCSNANCTSATTTTVDSIGYYNSITIGADGLPVISYADVVNSDLALKVAHCSNADCTSVTATILDSTGNLAASSITIGADGLPVISYVDFGDVNFSLKVARCSNADCTSATITTVDSGGRAGYPSITIGADGLPVISFTDFFATDLKVTHCSNAFCVPYLRRR